MKKNIFLTILAVIILAACNSSNNEKSCNNESSCNKEKTCNKETDNTMKTYKKKYTNADFYKDGKIQPQVALEAYKEMLAFYGVPFSKTLEANIWITDFELGDFENVGMAGIFWLNDAEHGYFGHEIYLLPGQMIPEHKHVATKFPAKFESWKVAQGWTYNFGIGEETPNAPQIPASQAGKTTCKNFAIQYVDEVLHLKEIESPHFLFAGDEGAIITEYGTFHDGDGLRFTNEGVIFTDMLTK